MWRLQAETISFDPMQADHDLWDLAQEQLRPVKSLVSFHKVCSHQRMDKLGLVEQWICSGNDSADKQAQIACHHLAPELLGAQARVSEQVQFRQQVSNHLVQHILRVGTLFTQHPREQAHTQPTSATTDEWAVDTKAIVNALQDQLPQSFSFQGVSNLLEWFASLTDPATTIKWVTWHELLISYQLQTGQRGVRCRNTTSGNHRQWERLTLQAEYDFPEVSRFFGHYCQQLIKRVDSSWKSSMRRPSNWRFQMWCGCVPLRFAKTQDDAVQAWLTAHASSNVFTSIKSMAMLPQAAGVAVGQSERKVGLWRFVR